MKSGQASCFFCPRPTFHALSHLSRFDSQPSPRGKDLDYSQSINQGDRDSEILLSANSFDSIEMFNNKTEQNDGSYREREG